MGLLTSQSCYSGKTLFVIIQKRARYIAEAL